jgi:hypothetical protein
LYPARAWLGMLVSVFAIESLIMVVLSRVLPADHGVLASFIVVMR